MAGRYRDAVIPAIFVVAFMAVYSVKSQGLSTIVSFALPMGLSYLCYMLTSYRWMPDPDRVLPLYLLAVGIQLLHFMEEFITGFYVRNPVEIYGANSFTADEFVISQMSVLFLLIIGAIGIYRGWKIPMVMVWFLVIFFLLINAIQHPLFAVVVGGYFPGLVTSVAGWVLGPILFKRLWEVRTQRNEGSASTGGRDGRRELAVSPRVSALSLLEKTSGRLLVAAAVALAIAIGWYLRARSGIEWDVQTARELVEEMGIWGPGIFILLVAFRLIFLVPSQVMLVAAGACFGFLWGTVYGAVGVALSGLMAFGVARYLGGDILRKRVPPGLQQALDVASRRTGALVVTMGTAYPIGPLTGYHIGAGLTCMSLWLYLPALVLGSLIRASLFTFLGSTVAELGIREAWPAFVILGAFFLPLLHPRVRSWVADGFHRSSHTPT
jgi:uncharacterized membrane protein YdjX (TVP38/TMEM64 family)